MNLRGNSGQASILVIGMATIVLAVMGLAVDGTKAFLYRRTLQSVADAAALAGAGELDANRYYSTSGRAIEIDPQAAAGTAHRMMALRGIDARASVEASGDRVVVVVRGRVPTLFLRLVGLDSVPVAVEAASAPVSMP